MKIITLSLHRAVTEAELRELFTPFGEVTSASLVLDKETGASKGFGFVEMSEEEGAAAIEALNNKRFRGNRIRVKLAGEKE